jgi:hypothetical protein
MAAAAPHHTGVRAVAMFVNTVDSAVPTAVTDMMITTAISAAISPYSIAVTPLSESRESLLKILLVKLLIFVLHVRHDMRCHAMKEPISVFGSSTVELYQISDKIKLIAAFTC